MSAAKARKARRQGHDEGACMGIRGGWFCFLGAQAFIRCCSTFAFYVSKIAAFRWALTCSVLCRSAPWIPSRLQSLLLNKRIVDAYPEVKAFGDMARFVKVWFCDDLARYYAGRDME